MHREHLIVVLAAAAACTATSARADVDWAFQSWSEYEYNVTHVPDFDQRRSTLPGAGEMYCVPTSSMNWLAYFASHGFPSMAPGVNTWHGQAAYEIASDALALMGVLMSTDAADGTTGGGLDDGFNTWVGDDYFVTSFYFADGDGAPTFDNVAFQVRAGGYAQVSVGWYDGSPPNITRDGGHQLTVTQLVHQPDGDQGIGWRDPASDDGDNTIQGAFTTEFFEVRDFAVSPDGMSSRTMSNIVAYSGGAAWIDSLHLTFPQFAMTSLDPGALIAYMPPGLTDVEEPETVIDLAGLDLVDLAVHPDLGTFIFLGEIPGETPSIWYRNWAANELEPIDVFMFDPRRVTLGRYRQLYVLDGGFNVACVNIEADVPWEQNRVETPSTVDAMTFDDEANQVVLISVQDRCVVRYAHTLFGGAQVRSLPATTPIEGEVTLVCDATRDGLWMLSQASDDLFLLTIDPATNQFMETVVCHPSIVDPKSIDVDDRGRLYVSSLGQVVELQEDEFGAWDLVPSPAYDGMAVGDRITVAKSRSNFNPALHSGPAWNHVLPDDSPQGIPDCVADFNDDNNIGFFDLSMVLGAWGPCAGCPEDLDGNGSVGFADLNILLAAWGACG